MSRDETHDAFQHRFWALFSAESEAIEALWKAQAIGGDVDYAMAVRVRARAAVEAFAREHPGRAFLVFRPEDIAAALKPTIAPLFEDER